MDFMAKIETNHLSKIYNQSNTQIKFTDVDEAKRFFCTEQALETFKLYCARQKWILINDNQSLHWTISFELDLNPVDNSYVPPSSLWRDAKQSLIDRDAWFVHPNWPRITHDAEHLF